jgi:hypothetical protein
MKLTEGKVWFTKEGYQYLYKKKLQFLCIYYNAVLHNSRY